MVFKNRPWGRGTKEHNYRDSYVSRCHDEIHCFIYLPEKLKAQSKLGRFKSWLQHSGQIWFAERRKHTYFNKLLHPNLSSLLENHSKLVCLITLWGLPNSTWELPVWDTFYITVNLTVCNFKPERILHQAQQGQPAVQHCPSGSPHVSAYPELRGVKRVFSLAKHVFHKPPSV